MGTPPPPAHGYTEIQPSVASYKSGAITEGFICAGIYAFVVCALFSGLRLWAEHTHPEKGILPAEEWGHFIGTVVGQSILMAICLSSVVFYRRRRKVTSFILLDWRWWLVCLVLAILPKKPVLAWLWVGVIYQARLSRKPKPSAPVVLV